MRTNEKTSTQYPDGIEINQTKIYMKKWTHIVFTVSGKTMKSYVNGSEVSTRTFSNYAVWPNDNRKVYISDPWNATGGFTLSKMKWYPFNLTADFIESIALSSFPLKKFTDDISFTPINSKNAVILTKGWREDRRVDHIPISALNHNGIVFLNGIIKDGAINGVMGFLPAQIRPDRKISVLVGGSNGPYRLEILPTGQMSLYDGTNFCNTCDKNKKTREMGKYIQGESIYLSNVRFPLSKGNSLQLSGASYYNSYPTYVVKGSMVYFTGGVKNQSHYPIRVPKNIAPPKSETFQTISAGNSVFTIDIYRSWCRGSCRKVIMGNGYESPASHPISLESIHYSFFNGERLKLESGFWNYSGSNGSWGYAQVTLDNSIVSLKGYINRRRNSQKHNGVTNNKSENKYSEGINKRLASGVNKDSCANLAKESGDKFFKIDEQGRCMGGKYYNTTKPKWNDFKEDMLKLPGHSRLSTISLNPTTTKIIQDSMPGKYFRQRSGYCSKPIHNLNECSKAGKSLGLNRNGGSHPWKNYFPKGCVTAWGRRYLNKSKSSNKKCSSRMACICKRNVIKPINNERIQIKNQDGTKLVVKHSDYAAPTFNWRQIYKAADEIKMTLLPANINANTFIGVIPAHVNKWDSQLGGKLSGFVQTSPNSKTDSNFLELGINNRYNMTTRRRGPQKYIDFTRKFNKLNDENYEIRVFNQNGTVNRVLVKFKKVDGKYIEKFNIKKTDNSTSEVFRLNERQEIITKLPQKYWPQQTHIFTVKSGWKNTSSGSVNIMINIIGQVILLDKIGGNGSGQISLSGISYMVDTIKSLGSTKKKKKRDIPKISKSNDISLNRVINWDYPTNNKNAKQSNEEKQVDKNLRASMIYVGPK